MARPAVSCPHVLEAQLPVRPRSSTALQDSHRRPIIFLAHLLLLSQLLRKPLERFALCDRSHSYRSPSSRQGWLHLRLHCRVFVAWRWASRWTHGDARPSCPPLAWDMVSSTSHQLLNRSPHDVWNPNRRTKSGRGTCRISRPQSYVHGSSARVRVQGWKVRRGTARSLLFRRWRAAHGVSASELIRYHT